MKRILAVFVIFLVGVSIIIYINNDLMNLKKLPVLSPCDVNPELYDSSLYRNCIGHKITNFNLIDQLNRKVNLDLLKNKIVVADFFFVSCPGICLKMTKNLGDIHQQFKTDTNFLILSHTVWPEVDKRELYRLARKNYLVAPDINDLNFDHGSQADFIHTENIVLVDKKQRIRGFYDGTDIESMRELVADIDILQRN